MYVPEVITTNKVHWFIRCSVLFMLCGSPKPDIIFNVVTSKPEHPKERPRPQVSHLLKPEHSCILWKLPHTTSQIDQPQLKYPFSYFAFPYFTNRVNPHPLIRKPSFMCAKYRIVLFSVLLTIWQRLQVITKFRVSTPCFVYQYLRLTAFVLFRPPCPEFHGLYSRYHGS